MMISLRLKDDLVEEIDRVALAHGQSRSAWIARVLAQSALAEGDDAPLVPVSKRGHPDDSVRVTLRLHRREIEAIDAVGAPLGLSRNEWLKRAIRWQLWDKAGVLRLAPITQAEIGKLRKQVLAIGRNINQAVHAMNAANMPGSSLDIARIATPFIETCADLKALLFGVRRTLSVYVSGEVAYWTGATEKEAE
ncbi:MAG: ribbon-helix-helix protein, CopG family [Sphingomonas sp.]|nr:MAG: ribbon-helix-helix protein, CopG family [Sphingomonas sp.]